MNPSTGIREFPAHEREANLREVNRCVKQFTQLQIRRRVRCRIAEPYQQIGIHARRVLPIMLPTKRY